MIPQRSSQTRRPAGNTGEMGKSSDNYPEWMVRAGFGPYTKYSNGVLESLMHSAETDFERIHAFLILHSWRLDSDFAMWGRGAATQANISKKLDIDKGNVSRTIKQMQQRGMLVVDDNGVMFPVAQPPIQIKAPLKQKEDQDKEIGVPSILHIKGTYFPTFNMESIAFWRSHNAFRAKERKVDKWCLEKQEEIRAQLVGCTTNQKELSVPPSEVAVQPQNGCLNNQGNGTDLLISTTLLTKQLASGAKNPASRTETEKASDAEKLVNLISKMQAQGLGSSLGAPNSTNIEALLKHGSPEEICYFLVDELRERHEPWRRWGGAIHAVKYDLPGWRTRNASMYEPTSLAAPAIHVNDADLIESTIEWALDTVLTMPNSVNYAQAVEEVANAERDHPELVAKIRARISTREAI